MLTYHLPFIASILFRHVNFMWRVRTLKLHDSEKHPGVLSAHRKSRRSFEANVFDRQGNTSAFYPKYVVVTQGVHKHNVFRILGHAHTWHSGVLPPAGITKQLS